MATKSIFEESEVSMEPPVEGEGPSDEEIVEEWNPTITEESPKDRNLRLGEKKEANGRILTISKFFFTRPKTKNQDGTKIEPKLTLENKKPYYPGKLGIRFVEENLVEYYPNFHYYIDEKTGNVSNIARINRAGNNEVTKLFNLVVEKMKKPAEEISDSEIFNYLVGKKVKMETTKGVYLGKPWFRNNINAFV